MEPDELIRLESLFHALVGIPAGAEREAAASRLSGGDADLALHALSLAALDEKVEAAKHIARQAASTPRLYGNYRTLRLLGSGGMGAVYLAERVDGQFEQTVAVKVIAPHAAGEAFRERFLAERQILAGLNHPNIAKLLDGGITPEGTPFLALEYVEGDPLDRYCDFRRLDIRARLELFRKVCEPVAYAHRNLVVHRDLKPSNILVEADGRPVLLDFGTARLLTGSAGDPTASPLLTLRYSSPERRGSAPSTTGEDIFSLGVILYELLTGAWPFGDPSSPDQILQGLRRETPMTTPGNAVNREASFARATNVRALKSNLAGDLTDVLGKALAEPEQRYESVQAFSADIANWLDGRPVSARPAAFTYRAGKFIRRNAAAVSLGAIMWLALVAATGTALYQAHLARNRNADLRTLTASLLFELKDAINDVPGSTPAQKILVGRVLKNLDKMARSSQDPELSAEMAEAYRQMGELQGSPYSQNLGDSKGALESLARARSMAEAGVRDHPRDALWLHLAGLAEATTAEVLFGSNQTAQAISHAATASSYYEAMSPLTRNAAWLADAAGAFGVFGDILGQAGNMGLADPIRAARQYRRAIEFDQMAIDASPAAVRPRRAIALMRVKLGDLIRDADPETALAEFRAAMVMFQQLPAEERSRPASQRMNATFLRKTGNALRDLQEWTAATETLQGALVYFRNVYATDPADKRAILDTAVIEADLVELFYVQPDAGNGLPHAERAAELFHELLRKDSGNPAWTLLAAHSDVRLATILSRGDNRSRALPLAATGLKELTRIAAAPGASARDLQVAARDFTEVEPKTLRDPARAVALARRCLETTGPENVTSQLTLAAALDLAGQKDEARARAQKGLALMAPVRGSRIPHMRMRLAAIR